MITINPAFEPYILWGLAVYLALIPTVGMLDSKMFSRLCKRLFKGKR